MSNRTFTNMINFVFDTLVAQADAGGTLPYVKPENIFLGEHNEDKNMKGRLPAIIVKEGRPSLAEKWDEIAATTRRADVVIMISFGIHPPDLKRPYGTSTGVSPAKIGYGVMKEDIMNAIENVSNGLRLGGNAVSIDITADDPDVQHEVYIGRITLAVWTLFFAGQR